jgi:hypothetical protein
MIGTLSMENVNRILYLYTSIAGVSADRKTTGEDTRNDQIWQRKRSKNLNHYAVDDDGDNLYVHSLAILS